MSIYEIQIVKSHINFDENALYFCGYKLCDNEADFDLIYQALSIFDKYLFSNKNLDEMIDLSFLPTVKLISDYPLKAYNKKNRVKIRMKIVQKKPCKSLLFTVNNNDLIISKLELNIMVNQLKGYIIRKDLRPFKKVDLNFVDNEKFEIKIGECIIW